MAKICYNKKALLQSEIQPLLDRLRALCQQHDLPLFVMLPYAATDEGDSAVKHGAVIMCGGDTRRMPDAMRVLINLAEAGALDEAMALVDSVFTLAEQAMAEQAGKARLK